VTRALNHHLSWFSGYELHLLSFGFGLLRFGSFLARPVELQQCHALWYTYCMYMHKMNIMDA
jgi:hypothetical protein